MTPRCFACNRALKGPAKLADTRDAQVVEVGPDCHHHITTAGGAGYQPPQGGPRLYPLEGD